MYKENKVFHCYFARLLIYVTFASQKFRSVERRFSNLATVMDCFEAMQMYALKENLTIEAMVVLVLWDFAELPAILLTFTTNNDG
ncbi:hypothetical protein T11_6404 [Trichinella zimbabwensis]|uniref:Uncharacterized protein n=1 Tax=Trichinella zimbabwensis TaxID=268475 RepID=A0A0V1GT91_9BILA|nr:hypothetical protein T11_6404 [Trichinella zimbabwensis]